MTPGTMFLSKLGTTDKSYSRFLPLLRRKLALLWEVAMLSRNAKTYNEEDSLIVEHARILTETLWKFIQ